MAYVQILTIILTISLIFPAQSQTCTSQKFTNKLIYQHCLDLPQLNAYIHWTYNSTNSNLSIAFVAPPAKPDGWVAWAINPSGIGMQGAQALAAFKDPKGSMIIKTFNLKSYSVIIPMKLSFEVMEMAGEYVEGLMRIFATMKLPETVGTMVNQVWQVGPAVEEDVMKEHLLGSANLDSKGTLDLLNGKILDAPNNSKSRNIHGILNIVSWGIMFPIGIMIARYLKTFPSADPLWFYLHVSCQICAYIIGVVGWGTGMKLGSESKGVHYSAHRNIGISLFGCATLQAFALFLRPKKDHKYRGWWNIYHAIMGGNVLVPGILNVFKGLDILQPLEMWKKTYTGFIIALGVVSVLLEIITWTIVIKRRRQSQKP